MVRLCAPRGLVDPLRAVCLNRDFVLFTAGTFVTATGLWVQNVTIGWVVLEISNSAFVLGAVGFARMIPILLLGFPAGALADRYDRRRLLLAAQSGSFAVALVLAGLAWMDLLSVPLMIGLAALAGVCDAVAWPVITVFVKDIVGPEQLRLAVAINQARFNLTRVIGPIVGGFLLAGLGAPAALTFSAAAGLGVIAVLCLIRSSGGAPAEGDGPWLQRLSDGVRYAWHVPRVRRLLLITAGVGFFALPFQHLLPAVARDRLALGPEGLGILTGAVGVGAIVGAVLSPTRLAQRCTRPLLVGLPVGAGVALAGLGLSRELPPALLSLGAAGLCIIAYMAISSAVLQLMVREEVTGRVVGLMTVVQGGVMPLGALALGGAADLLGLPTAFLLAGAGAAAVALVFGGRSAAAWVNEETREAEPDAQSAPPAAQPAAREEEPVGAGSR